VTSLIHMQDTAIDPAVRAQHTLRHLAAERPN